MQAFKIDIMALLVMAVVLGVGLTMALSHPRESTQVPAMPEVSARVHLQTPGNPVQAQFVKAAQPANVMAVGSRI